MHSILNISAYKFVPLPDAVALREVLLARALQLELKGTILLATEGINLFLAGSRDNVTAFLDTLRSDPRLTDLRTKESWSAEVPFRKMLVKMKPEIIRMNHPTIRPDASAHRGELQGKTVVSFCTGGIRCEKAAIFMREARLPHVWQLEGGILQYFEETGGAHFDGSCFVFDERRALDADLSTHES